MKKTAAFIVTASLASSALFGFSPAITAHAITKTAAEQSIPQGPQAALNSIYKLANKGQMPYYAEGLKIGVQTKKDVHHKLGQPYPETGQSGFDLYHAEMGNPGFAFHYDAKGKIDEIRYFGTNVERETNIGDDSFPIKETAWTSGFGQHHPSDKREKIRVSNWRL